MIYSCCVCNEYRGIPPTAAKGPQLPLLGRSSGVAKLQGGRLSCCLMPICMYILVTAQQQVFIIMTALLSTMLIPNCFHSRPLMGPPTTRRLTRWRSPYSGPIVYWTCSSAGEKGKKKGDGTKRSHNQLESSPGRLSLHSAAPGMPLSTRAMWKSTCRY
ncbi:hypothetical protein F5Y15DRAFT_375429 [Xylariaceae sp. FL0016]|nr:hypothetical protein F5Y15DRAFT_375429 [Xylariaceae sp. FL0016]